MRVKCCYCHRNGVITHRVEVTDKVSELYVSCPNPQCGARTVLRLSYSYTVAPPAETQTNALCEQLAQLDAETRRKLLQTYCGT